MAITTNSIIREHIPEKTAVDWDAIYQIPTPTLQPKLRPRQTVRLAQAVMILAGLVFVVLLTPPIFAQVVSQIDGVIRQFGNMTVKEVEVHPDILYAELVATSEAVAPAEEPTLEPAVEEVTNAPTTFPDDCTWPETLRGQPVLGTMDLGEEDPNVTIIQPDCLDLEEAIARAGYDFSLPSLIPNGLWLEGEVSAIFSEYGTALTFFWRNEMGNRPLHLDVSRARPDNNVLLAPGMYEEIAVNGRPGIFIYGAWSNDINDWDRSIVRTVRWEQDGVMYNLVGFQHSESNVFISDVMLKRIAGSIE